MNTSYENFDNFCKIAFPFLKIIFDKLSALEFNTIKFLFGDNYRCIYSNQYKIVFYNRKIILGALFNMPT